MPMNPMTPSPPYVLITPARNEEAFIEKTVTSVIQQQVLPVRWVIVSDASSDRTDAIVQRYLPDHPWMMLIRMPEKRDRSFAAKVACFNAGYRLVRDLDYEVIGNLDADISFDEEYLGFLLEKFRTLPELGVAGTPFRENGYSSVEDSFEGERHVAGGCQLFRRQCFEAIGGYTPVKEGIDWVAVTTARMKGWTTRSFPEKHFFHYRPLGTGESNTVGSLLRYGKKDYLLGGHPLWEMFRVAYRVRKKPYVWGSAVLLAGYLSALARGERYVSVELAQFHRREQMEKLRLILKAALTFRKIDKFHLKAAWVVAWLLPTGWH
jgi:glycosyltransferase involved in cell wall biosynthesis